MLTFINEICQPPTPLCEWLCPIGDSQGSLPQTSTSYPSVKWIIMMDTLWTHKINIGSNTYVIAHTYTHHFIHPYKAPKKSSMCVCVCVSSSLWKQINMYSYVQQKWATVLLISTTNYLYLYLITFPHRVTTDASPEQDQMYEHGDKNSQRS